MKRSVLVAALLLLGAVACSGNSGSYGSPSSPTPAPLATSTPLSAGGPSLQIDPRSGPPGTDVGVSGRGWPAGAEVLLTARDSAQGAAPYARVTAASDGSFAARFRLERTPGGKTLPTGRYDLVARGAGVEVAVSFLVETPRPIGGGSSGGG